IEELTSFCPVFYFNACSVLAASPSVLFLFHGFVRNRDLHSFPTRRSSDLADGIGVFDVQQNKLVRTIQSGSDPENFDLTKDGRTIIVSNEDYAKASFIDDNSGKVTKSVTVGEEPEGVKVSPNGKFVYVTSENNGTISAIDVASAKLIKTFKVGRRPRSVAFMPDSSRAYVSA